MADASLPVFDFDDGTRFVPHARAHPGTSPFDDWSEDELKTFFTTLWKEAFDAKKPETARLKHNALYYDGFHFKTSWLNRVNVITNRIYALVEQQVALAIAEVPRPEIVPRQGQPAEVANRLQQYAEWIQDQDDFDDAIYVGARDKFIYGWNAWLVSIDHETGMPSPKNLSVFDLYWDPVARNEDEAMYFIIAQAVSTHRLRATFPQCVDDDGKSTIESDHIASPSYDVTKQPWKEFIENEVSTAGPLSPDVAMAVHYEGETPTQTITLCADTGSRSEHGQSTFLVQLLIRDEALCEVKYDGVFFNPEGGQEDGEFYNHEPQSESGWWIVSYTAAGVRLHDPYEVDPAFLGCPIVIDRMAKRADRFESMSAVDQCIPIQREANRRKKLIMDALELSANPPVIASVGNALSLKKGTISAGEMMTITRGSDVKYLEFRGPSPQQFEARGESQNDLQTVAGVPDVQAGFKPSGVEAASAIRRLDDNSMRRVNGMENPAHRARCELLRKIVYAAGKKMGASVSFQASGGDLVTVTSEELTSQFNIRMARGTGNPDARRDLEERAGYLLDKGVIEPSDVLDMFNWPNRTAIKTRIAQRQLQQMQMDAEAKAAALGGAAGAGGSAPPSTAAPVAA